MCCDPLMALVLLCHPALAIITHKTLPAVVPAGTANKQHTNKITERNASAVHVINFFCATGKQNWPLQLCKAIFFLSSTGTFICISSKIHICCSMLALIIFRRTLGETAWDSVAARICINLIARFFRRLEIRSVVSVCSPGTGPLFLRFALG